MDSCLKVDGPHLNGCFGIEEFLDWTTDVDRFFEYMDTPSSEKMIRFVACRLRRFASAWWN